MSYWTNKTAIVTGAGSGIGRALVSALGARGVLVVATDIDPLSAAAAIQNIPSATSGTLDVRDAAAFETVVGQTVAAHGRLDFLFNNAGVGVAGESHELTREHWQYVLDVNVWGVVHGILAAYPGMWRQRSGHIVNTASLAGLGVAPLLLPYAASKHAVVGMSTSLRVEAADRNVRVTALCPAAIETPLLDRDNLPGLPNISWHPNLRRYLARLAGSPYPVAKFAEQALDGVERNKAIVVIPGRARLAWRMTRLAPELVERLALRTVRAERAER